MNMQLYIIIYLLVYRLAIITTGTICVILGYLLFCKGVLTESNIKVKMTKMEFLFKKAAPGTLFAFFGIIVISLMITSKYPGYTSKTITNSNNGDSKIIHNEQFRGKGKNDFKKSASKSSSEIAIRGSKISAHEQGILYEKEGKFDEAIQMYHKAINENFKSFDGVDWLFYLFSNEQINLKSTPQISQITNTAEITDRKESSQNVALNNKISNAIDRASESINGLAWLFYKKSSELLDNSLILSRIAVQNKPDEANYLDTLSEILYKKVIMKKL